jgi:hypothetical protein
MFNFDKFIDIHKTPIKIPLIQNKEVINKINLLKKKHKQFKNDLRNIEIVNYNNERDTKFINTLKQNLDKIDNVDNDDINTGIINIINNMDNVDKIDNVDNDIINIINNMDNIDNVDNEKELLVKTPNKKSGFSKRFFK